MTKKNNEAKPFTLVRELREFAEAKRVRDAANTTYKSLAERAAATMQAAGQWPESVDKKSAYTVKIGATAALVQEVTMRNTRKLDEAAAVDGLKKARAAREALEAAEAADAIEGTGDASREELVAAVEAYREAAAAALKALRDVAAPETVVTVNRVPVRSYSVTL